MKMTIVDWFCITQWGVEIGSQWLQKVLQPAAKKLQANIFCRHQTLFSRYMNKLQAVPACEFKMGNASSDFFIAFL
jgi:hypothetical protein